jgi:hypothetical protein
MAVEIEITRGSTFSQTLLCVDELDVAIDLTNWSFSSDLKAQAGNSKLLAFSIDDSEKASGQIKLGATPDETVNLPPSMLLLFDVKFTDPSGDVHYSEKIELITSKHITH